VETQQYQRKPIIVDAVRVTEDNFTEVAHWCQGAIWMSHGTTLDTLKDDKSKHIKVRVINPQKDRHTKAFVGDWVLYSEYNGYKVYTETAFRNAFIGPVEPSLTVEQAVERLRAAGHIVDMPENNGVHPEQTEMIPDGTYGGAREVGPETTGV
jgi:hypothetical protein